MHPRLLAAFVGRGELLTRRELTGVGLSPSDINRLARVGEIVAVRRNVYARKEFWDALDQRVGRRLYVERAASRNMLVPHVASHDWAAHELGMELLEPRNPMVHVTRFGVVGSRSAHGVKHHKAPFTPDQITFVEGLPVLDRARTAVDIAREHGLNHGVVACDSAMRAGVTRAELESAYAPMRCWQHVTRVRAAVDLADPGAENGGESLSRVLVHELDIGRPQTQFGLTDGRREVWCDLRVGRHIFEFDGRIKYRSQADGGVAAVPPEQVLWEEKQRQDFICGFKLGMSRIVWDDLWGQRREQVRRRLLREYLDTQARFGDSIVDLEPFIIRRERRRRL